MTVNTFTFYNIYIKTVQDVEHVLVYAQFTFYNIYIKTKVQKDYKLDQIHLHSTIFILKPNTETEQFEEMLFTFYNIYIKTTTAYETKLKGIATFTFYNIYIKT